MQSILQIRSYISNTFTDLPAVTNIRNVSRICVTSFNISWDPPNSITCGDVSYEVSVVQPPIEGDAVTTTVNTFLSITGLNNSLPDVKITVTASNRAGRGDGRMFPVHLPRSLGKCVHKYVQNQQLSVYADYAHIPYCLELWPGCLFLSSDF